MSIPGMRVAILAGGRGSRLGAETAEKPKALVEIGGRPILWHIMGHLARHGLRDFVLALGYRGDRIRSWTEGSGLPPEWRIELVETGAETATGGRVRRLLPHVGDGTFVLTYSDTLSDLDLAALVGFHRSHGRLATMTAVHPRSPFGHLEIEGEEVTRFAEKPVLEEWANGGFFVLEPGIGELIDGDDTVWEREPLERLAKEGELMAYRHGSFWQCMDTPADREVLEEHWRSERAPWTAEA